MNKKVAFIDWGLIDYQQAWQKQEEIFDGTIAIKTANRTNGTQTETPNYLIFCEHPHVYTLGKSGHPENLLLDESGLADNNAAYYKINRGGDITYHGPGQIVGYPILDLDNFFTDIHLYLRTLEEAVILTLKDYGIAAGRYPGYTGVWIDADNEKARKICAMGVRCSRWVTMHGFAFNVNTDLNYFNHIVPCRIDDKDVTSMERELGKTLPLEEVKATLKRHLASLFSMELSAPAKEGLNYIALGDSYTIGEAVEKEENFPTQLVNQLSQSLPVNPPTIIAQTGWTTAELLEAIPLSGVVQKFDLVTLLIGVNNQYRGQSKETYRKEFKDLLQIALDYAKNDRTHVLVVSIPDWGVTPFAKLSGRDQQTISREIDAFNSINEEETLSLGINYINITPDSRNASVEPALIAADGLHPSAKMYSNWVSKLTPVVLNLFK